MARCFVSVEGHDTLTTEPFVFCGTTLRINADARGGTLRVAALDASGQAMKGFGHADSLPFTSDYIRHVIKWPGKADCRLLQGKPIALRCYIDKAKLYSFEAITAPPR